MIIREKVNLKNGKSKHENFLNAKHEGNSTLVNERQIDPNWIKEEGKGEEMGSAARTSVMVVPLLEGRKEEKGDEHKNTDWLVA